MFTRTPLLIAASEPVGQPPEAAALAVPTYDLASIYDAWFRTVYRWVIALGGPRVEADDLAQEIFLVVQRKLEAFDGRNLPGWLYQITENTVSDYRRRMWFRKIFLRNREVVLESLPSHAENSEDLVSKRQQQQRFYAVVQRMSGTWRESFVLFEVLGYKTEEIAGLRGIPSATVRTHLHRARKEFTTLWAKERRS